MESMIKTVYENYRNSFGDNKPESEGTKKEFDNFTSELDKINISPAIYDKIYNSAILYGDEREEFGFITGFKIAANIIKECEI